MYRWVEVQPPPCFAKLNQLRSEIEVPSRFLKLIENDNIFSSCTIFSGGGWWLQKKTIGAYLFL